MRRLFLAARLADTMQVGGEDAYHMSRVLRMKPGDKLIVVDCEQQSGVAEIVAAADNELSLVLIERIAETKEPPVEVCLVQGLAKNDKMDYIIQKAVELGVHRIIPLQSQHVVVQYDAKKRAERVARWNKIAVEAAKQCGRLHIPVVEAIHTLPEALAATADTKLIMLYEGKSQQGLKQVLQEKQEAYTLLIGPEGGFSTAEVESCLVKQAVTATLGPRILRTETAALAAIAVVMYQCGDLGG